MYLHLARKQESMIPLVDENLSRYLGTTWFFLGIGEKRTSLSRKKLEQIFKNRKLIKMSAHKEPYNNYTRVSVPTDIEYDCMKVKGAGGFLVFGFFDAICYSVSEVSYLEIAPISFCKTKEEAEGAIVKLNSEGPIFDKCQYKDNYIAKVRWGGYRCIQLDRLSI